MVRSGVQPSVAQAPVTGHDENGPTAGHLGDPPDISEFLGAVRLRGPSCTIATIREALPEQRVAALDAAMAMDNRSMPHTVISEVVTKWLGVSPVGSLTRVGSDIVNRHRNGRCACRKD